jgi:stearoyl-CoA desaturase (Delta-9 desaturase)
MKLITAQASIALASFLCLFFLLWYTTQFSWYWLIVSYIYYKIVVGLLGNQIAQHRYYSHKSFQVGTAKQWILYFASLTTGVNPVFYALAHRHHHKYSDNEQDLHSVHNHWADIFAPLTAKTKCAGNIEISRVLTGQQRKINNHWHWIFLSYVAIAAAVDWRIGIFVIAAGPAWNYIHMILFRVWLTHVRLPGSYRNFDTDDRSWNNKWIQLLDIGEGLHNNHHRWPGRCSQAINSNEVDPCAWVIKKFLTSNI